MVRTLLCISNYGTGQMRHLVSVLDAWNEADGETDVVLHTTHPLYIEYPRLRIFNVSCPPEARQLIVWAHRGLMVEKRQQYDRFIFSENDLLITPENLRCWEELTAQLPPEQVVGFLRYEKSHPDDGELYLPDAHTDYPVFESLQTVGGQLYFTIQNKHQGCYLLTREQLNLAISSGAFLRRPGTNPPYGLLESASSDIFTLCGLEKVLPYEQLESVLIHHLPNKYVNNHDGIWVRKPHSVRTLKELVQSHLETSCGKQC